MFSVQGNVPLTLGTESTSTYNNNVFAMFYIFSIVVMATF